MRIVLVAAGLALSAACALALTHPIIFFMGGDVNELKPQQWQLTVEAVPMLHRVVREFKDYNDRYVLITGYDEDASTAELSYARSLKRAETVRDALIGLGLPRDALVVKACGAKDLLVNVAGKEPQNRRVTFNSVQTLQSLLDIDREICPGVQQKR
jgi:hypothetical protein